MGSHTMGPGTVLGGRYRLDDLLTDHDGARFWRATDLVLSRSVAVHAVASDDERATDVLDAARTSATVTDAHFLRVLDCDDDGRLTWVINEWGSGLSLDLMLQRGAVPPGRAAWLTREVAEAIAAAHEQGVHHGRLNPESVLVTDSGAVKVIGFVTQRAFEGDPPGAPYGDLDAREADVIDLAGILYAALTGRWAGVSASAVPAAPREGGRPLRPRQVRAGIPRTLDQICERVLNKEAWQHAMPIETAQEIAAALSDFVGDPGASAPMDVPSMYAEQTIAMPRAAADGAPTARRSGGDPDATVAAAPPVPSSASPVERTTGTERDGEPVSEPLSEPVSEPPPFEEPPERPLFADHERRVPKDAPPLPPYPPPGRTSAGTQTGTGSGTGGFGTGTGTGTGAGAAYWPFVEDPEASGTFSGKEGRGWLRLAAIIAVIVALVVAMFLAFSYGRGDEQQQPSAEPTRKSPSASVGAPVKIVDASDFDPEGNPSSENPDEVPLAFDGNPGTGWKTLTYQGNPRLGGLKSGVGLLLDLGTDRTVGSVEVSLAGSPTQLELYAAPTGVSDQPADLGGLQQVTNSVRADESVTLRPRGDLQTRFVVIWLTSLPEVSDGYRGEITEVTVHS